MSTDLHGGESRRRRRLWLLPSRPPARCVVCTPQCRCDAWVGPPLRDQAARPAANRRPLWLSLHCASARFARLRSVPRQPKPLEKEHQKNSPSSLPFFFSPCSLIKSTTAVSEMLARRASRDDKHPRRRHVWFLFH